MLDSISKLSIDELQNLLYNLYRKLAQAKTEQEMKDWEEEITDRFGPVPQETANLIIAGKIKLFASKQYFTKVTIRANRMWLVCPKPASEMGNVFYDSGKFQYILSKLETLKPGLFQVLQKDDSVRFVVHEITNQNAALSFLKQLDTNS